MIDPIAKLRQIEAEQNEAKRHRLPETLARLQDELRGRVTEVEAQGYVDDDTRAMLERAEALTLAIRWERWKRNAGGTAKVLFWIGMTPVLALLLAAIGASIWLGTISG